MNLSQIENDFLKVVISSRGAELQSIIQKTNNIEYLWQGDENFWGKRSPVLFPIVGGLKNNEYLFEEKKYNLPRHGFARDMVFESHQISDTKITFSLKYTEETFLKYPFKFKFEVNYLLENNTIKCSYEVINLDVEKPLYASFGAHPAFNIPLTRDSNFEDWSLCFSSPENAQIYPLTEDGLIKNESIDYFDNTVELPLKKSLFYKDALVFKNLISNLISVKSTKSQLGFDFYSSNFKFYGIWSAKDAPFICLEPWNGIADMEDCNGNLVDKEGIIKIEKNDRSQPSFWLLTCY